LKKLIENTTAASNPSWITRWTTFYRWMVEILADGDAHALGDYPYATPHAITNSNANGAVFWLCGKFRIILYFYARSLIALILAASLSLGGAADAFGQSSRQKRKRKSPRLRHANRLQARDLRAHVAADTPADEAAQRELWDLARAMRNGVPGRTRGCRRSPVKKHDQRLGRARRAGARYEDNSKTATRNPSDGCSKRRTTRCCASTRCTGRRRRSAALGRYADAYKVLQTIQRDYPNTAMREPLLEAFVPTAVPARSRRRKRLMR